MVEENSDRLFPVSFVRVKTVFRKQKLKCIKLAWNNARINPVKNL